MYGWHTRGERYKCNDGGAFDDGKNQSLVLKWNKNDLLKMRVK